MYTMYLGKNFCEFISFFLFVINFINEQLSMSHCIEAMHVTKESGSMPPFSCNRGHEFDGKFCSDLSSLCILRILTSLASTSFGSVETGGNAIKR